MPKQLYMPTDEEDAAINAGIALDPDAQPVPDAEWQAAVAAGRVKRATRSADRLVARGIKDMDRRDLENFAAYIIGTADETTQSKTSIRHMASSLIEWADNELQGGEN